MTFVSGQSRDISTNPRTAAHFRATLAKLAQLNAEDFASIEELTSLVESLSDSFTINRETDENLDQAQFVYMKSTEHVALGDASDGNKLPLVGAAQVGAAAGKFVDIVQYGAVSRDSWGLTPGALYYLSASSPGEVTSTPLTTTGQYLIIVGRAVDDETLFIDIEPSILL